MGQQQQLTYEVVGFANVLVPHSDLQGLLGQLIVFDVVGELLQTICT